MPEEAVATQDAPAGDDTRTFGTPLESIFAQIMPTDEELATQQPEKKPDLPAQDEPEPEPVPEKAPKVKTEPKKEDKAAVAPKDEPTSISDILFKEPDSAVPSPEKTDTEPVRVETPAEFKGKTKEHFEKLSLSEFEHRKKAAAAEKKIAELEKRQADGDPAAKERIQALETQLKQYDALVERANLEMHPRFQAEFVIPRQQLLESARNAAQDAGVDPQALEAALALKGKAQAERLDELYADITSPTLRGKIERAVDNIGNLDSRKENVLKNQAVVMKQLQQEDLVRQNKELERTEQTVKAGLRAAQNLLQDKFKMFAPVDNPQYKDWNERLDRDDKIAETIMLKITDPTEMAVAAKLASRFPATYDALMEVCMENKELKRQLQDYRGSEPDLGGGGNRKVANTDDDDEELGVAEAMIRGLHRG